MFEWCDMVNCALMPPMESGTPSTLMHKDCIASLCWRNTALSQKLLSRGQVCVAAHRQGLPKLGKIGADYFMYIVRSCER